jgi:hypothetical protein
MTIIFNNVSKKTKASLKDVRDRVLNGVARAKQRLSRKVECAFKRAVQLLPIPAAIWAFSGINWSDPSVTAHLPYFFWMVMLLWCASITERHPEPWDMYEYCRVNKTPEPRAQVWLTAA